MAEIVIVGGCGHVGLPLGIVLADSGHVVTALDLDDQKMKLVNSGVMPFLEEGAEDLLRKVLKSENFVATTDESILANAEVIIVVIGTPVDEHMNPDPTAVVNVVSASVRIAKKCKLLMLRSTIYPGVTKRIEEVVQGINTHIAVSFCPERILEGEALKELASLPQIIGARSVEAIQESKKIFESLGVETVCVSPEEAEFAKLITNSWRYIKFAAANEFFNMTEEAGVDYSKVLEAVKFNYPRAADLPRAGFAAGPCLLKDTMQLAAFSNNNFQLGNSAMTANEGLPLRIVERLKRQYELKNLTVGILGMAFKAESDDPRASLSYKLKRILQFEAKTVLTTDPYVKDDEDLKELDFVCAASDVLILATPHAIYREMRFDIPVVDTWGILTNVSK